MSTHAVPIAPRVQISRAGSRLACCALLALISLGPGSSAASAQQIQPLAHDGLSLAEQPLDIQTLFGAVWGGRQPERGGYRSMTPSSREGDHSEFRESASLHVDRRGSPP